MKVTGGIQSRSWPQFMEDLKRVNDEEDDRFTVQVRARRVGNLGFFRCARNLKEAHGLSPDH